MVKTLAPRVPAIVMAALTSKLATGLKSACISKHTLTEFLAV